MTLATIDAQLDTLSLLLARARVVLRLLERRFERLLRERAAIAAVDEKVKREASRTATWNAIWGDEDTQP